MEKPALQMVEGTRVGSLRGRAAKGAMVGAALALLTGACGPMPEGEEGAEVVSQAQIGDNGLVYNGLVYNGLVYNGLVYNGLVYNGLVYNGLVYNGATASDFSKWFNDADNGDIALHASTMKYAIRCALKAGDVATFIDKNLSLHTWTGGLGLAPAWSTTTPTAEEKKLVSACMMAHVNNAAGGARSIQISLRGAHSSLATSGYEQDVSALGDGAYFGDLFSSSSKMYVCTRTNAAPSKLYDTLLREWGRQCYTDPAGCGLFTKVDCATSCTRMPNGTDIDTCTVGGETYKAVNVYIPKVLYPRNATVTGATLSTACTNCIDGQMINKITTASAVKYSSLAPNAGGKMLLDVRYSNPTADRKGVGMKTYLKVMVNGVAVLNGLTTNWDFAYTGADVWGTRTIAVDVPKGGVLTISGTTAGAAPIVNIISVRAP